MKDAVGGRPLLRLWRALFDPEGRRIQVIGPLNDGPVHQPRANPRAEQHRHPRKVGVIRLGVLATQPALAVLAECHDQQHDGRAKRHPLIQKAKLTGNPVIYGRNQHRRLPGNQGHRAAHAHNQCRAGAEQRPVDRRSLHDLTPAGASSSNRLRKNQWAPAGSSKSCRCLSVSGRCLGAVTRVRDQESCDAQYL